MKPETSVSTTAALGFYVSPTLGRQSELVREWGREEIIPLSPWRFTSGEVVREPPSDNVTPESAHCVDWSSAERRLRELYPQPVGGISMADLISEGRSNR